MSKINTYVDKSGYKIRATEKAFNLYYKKQGFKPLAEAEQKVPEQTNEAPETVETEPEMGNPDDAVADQTDENVEDSDSVEDFNNSEEYKSWSVASLKEALNEAGIEYPKSATKAELYQLMIAGKEV